MKGRNQTTKGIWFAKSTKITEPVTMVMDLEGSDGRERGEDDTSFERQSSLFALAVADILLVNMWAKDIGREAGSGKPLLKTIFQVCICTMHVYGRLPASMHSQSQHGCIVGMLMLHVMQNEQLLGECNPAAFTYPILLCRST